MGYTNHSHICIGNVILDPHPLQFLAKIQSVPVLSPNHNMAMDLHSVTFCDLVFNSSKKILFLVLKIICLQMNKVQTRPKTKHANK